MQAMVEVMSDHHHVFEVGRGRVVRRAAQALHQDRGTATTFISLLVGGQFEPH